MSAPKKPESVESIARQLNDAGFPNEIYLGRTDGDWPIRVWDGGFEKQVADWMLEKRSRHVVKIDLSRGIVEEIVAKETVVERHLEVKP